jgi:hypothetical protein
VNGQTIYTTWKEINDKKLEEIKNEAARPCMMTDLSN